MAKSVKRNRGNGPKTRRPSIANLTFQKPLRHDLTELKARLANGESFWLLIYPLYMHRFITKADVVDLIEPALTMARGHYKTLAKDWNIPTGDYKKFLNFLRKHGLQIPFRPFRSLRMVATPSADTRKTSKPA
jgi:hypothetical protein